MSPLEERDLLKQWNTDMGVKSDRSPSSEMTGNSIKVFADIQRLAQFKLIIESKKQQQIGLYERKKKDSQLIHHRNLFLLIKTD